MEDQTTPLMKQYWDIKAQAGDALLFFRMGDFYELFGDDAVEAARILEITLTSRDKNKPNPVPMAGVPHHSAQGYIQRLLKAGKKVAIGEQMEDPASLPKGTKLVKRELTRIFTPGVQFDLDAAEANYLAAIVPADSDGPNAFALACIDSSTGETLVSDAIDFETLSSELISLPIKHVLKIHGTPDLPLSSDVLVETLPVNYLSQEQATECLKRHYEIDTLNTFVQEPASAHALGIALTYATRTQQQERLAHLRLPVPLRKPTTMVLGPRSAQHLDLTPDLYQFINHTRSALGARQLKHWLLAPLKSVSEIRARQESVREFSKSTVFSVTRISSELAQIYDLERISGRISTGLANPRDTLALGKSLSALSRIAGHLDHVQSPLLSQMQKQLSKLATRIGPLGARIVTQQRDDAPLVSREGGIFNHGTHLELDRLLLLNENGQRWLIDLETRERESTGIPSLKVRYNRVFGYYIEITQAHLKNAPAHYQRKQTTVGAERFFTEELKKFEDEIVNASSRQRALEQDLFNDLLKTIQAETSVIMEAARVLGELDAIQSLATLTTNVGWNFPVIDDSLDLEIQGGRHPLVDAATRGAFVPNDLNLSPQTRLTLMITGPNMGGKSTVMRQTALIVILGQIGAPVPASSARWGAVSSLHTRIGAHDAIARGQSTFMVEMSELAQILHTADERSLLVLDEIGRGTSTYDGISVAWAALEWICNEIRARTLFATHYHELTRLSETLPRCANAHMAVERGGGAASNLRFLYQLKEGPTNDSFGIHVAKIAGLPKPVIDRAWQILEELEKHQPQPEGTVSVASAQSEQLSLFSEPDPILTALENSNPNEMTPIQALNFVVRLQEISKESKKSSTRFQS